jgi:hypothetical protein
VTTSASGVELSATYQRWGYAHATADPYFAPRNVRLLELAAYVERESARGIVLAIDAGAGAQQITPFDTTTASTTPTWPPRSGPGSGARRRSAPGVSSPALRLSAQLSVPITRRLQLHADLDAYESEAALTATSSGWHYAAGAVSLQWAMR